MAAFLRQHAAPSSCELKAQCGTVTAAWWPEEEQETTAIRQAWRRDVTDQWDASEQGVSIGTAFLCYFYF